MHVQVAIPSGPRPKPLLKRKDPNVVHLTEEEAFQLTFNRAKHTIGKLPDPQPDDAEATPPAWSNSLEKSQHPSECSKHLKDNDAESATPDTEDKVEDPPPCSKVNFRCPPTTYHHAPGTEDEEPPPSSAKQNTTRPSPSAGKGFNIPGWAQGLSECRPPCPLSPRKIQTPFRARLDNDGGDDHPPSATSHIESNKDMATGTASHLADETLADVEYVEQLVLLGDATSTNARAMASPRSHSSSLEWPGLDVDFTQIEEHEDPYEVEPETKAFNEDISDDESDAYKPDDDSKDANKVVEEEEVLLSPKVIQTKGKVQTAPSKVKGGKKKAKRAALLRGVGRKSKKGPLSKEALAECEEFGREMEERATALAKKFGKKTRSIFVAASLSTSATRKESVWNMHQSWFFATQGQNDGRF
ncbi:hypothetical protein PAXINDRAFT_10130 [Paxillus involutus ATCC 200175]|nr:hypothetical protein PAXINDRAFT_10130 [Paxillus involutus ATCC 200175]